MVFFNEESFQKSEMIHLIFAEGPGVAREKKNLQKIFKKMFKLCQPQAIHECPQNISAHSVQSFGRPEGNIYECLVLLY